MYGCQVLIGNLRFFLKKENPRSFWGLLGLKCHWTFLGLIGISLAGVGWGEGF